MKTTITIILSCLVFVAGFTSVVFAQGVEIECDEDVIIRDGIDIQFPTISADSEHIVTVLGIGDYDPVVAVFNQQQSGACNDDSFEASGYSLDFPTTAFVIPSVFNAQMTYNNNTFMRVVVGELDNIDGEAVVMVEGLSFDGQADTIDVIVTERMVESQIPLTAYVVEVTEDLDLSIALVDDNGVPLFDEVGNTVECDDAGDETLCWGVHVPLIESYTNVSNTRVTSATAISPMLSVPLTPDDAGTIVPFQIKQSALAEEVITGDYIFVLHYGVGDVGIGDGLATATTSPLGTSLSCDDLLALNDAIEVTLPSVDSLVSIHGLAQGEVDPIFALMSDDNNGACHNTSGIGSQQSAQLPLAGLFNSSATNATADILTNSARLLTGLLGDVAGSHLLVFDGMNIADEGTPDIVSVTVTEPMVESGEPVIAYMLSYTLDLNPELTLVSAEQTPLSDTNGTLISCVHTSLPDSCYGEYDDMNTAILTLRDANTLRGISNDVMLSIPLSEDMIGTTLNFMASGANGTSGDYALMLYLTSGILEPTEDE